MRTKERQSLCFFWRNGYFCYVSRNPTWESTSTNMWTRFFQWKLWAFSHVNFVVLHWYTTMAVAFILNVNIAYVRYIGGFLGEWLQVNTLYIRVLHHLLFIQVSHHHKSPIVQHLKFWLMNSWITEKFVTVNPQACRILSTSGWFSRIFAGLPLIHKQKQGVSNISSYLYLALLSCHGPCKSCIILVRRALGSCSKPFRNESWRGCAVIGMGFAMASQVSHTIHRYIYLQEWLIFIGWWR